MVAPGGAHPGQGRSYELTRLLIGEILAADTILLGLPLYNFGPPSTVKAWSITSSRAGPRSIRRPARAARRPRLARARPRGGGYGPGTPRDGWDHAEPWLPHGVRLGLQPRFITAELTLAGVNPAMAGLKPLAAESLAVAQRGLDELWAPVAA